MKIEIGESLLLSWLKHIKKCQLVQTNWKTSSKWELINKETLEQLMKTSNELFSQKYGYDIYKGNKSLDQLMGQAEIDVIGIRYEKNQNYIYAIDVAFHESGLNYGSKEETVTRILKKCLRTAMCIYGYFGFNTGTIIFTSPKINPSVEKDLMSCIDGISLVLKDLGLNYKIRIIGNDDFSEKILEPVLNILGDVADTSELFMRSLQMYNLCSRKRSTSQRIATARKSTSNINMIKSQVIDGLDEMKIGFIVKTVLRKMLEDGKISKEEIEKMQTKEYSKETFHIQYPLLQKSDLTLEKKPRRYYSEPLTVYGEEYLLCSEWFETPSNNDRPYLMKWLALHK